MIKVDLPTAIVLYLMISLVLVLVPWVWHAWRHRPKPLDTIQKTAARCDICLYAFIGSTQDIPQRCPRCNSWIKIPVSTLN